MRTQTTRFSRQPLTTFSTRSGALRAARSACKKALAADGYEASEGPDFEIHSDSNGVGHRCGDRFYFKLRGPAADASCGRA